MWASRSQRDRQQQREQEERNAEMLMTDMNSTNAFLHTIPEGSSDVGAASSAFNPAAAAAASPTGSISNSAWATTMKFLRSSASSPSSRPDPPPSVASSTRAVEAGTAGGITSSVSGQMDSSNTAVNPADFSDVAPGPGVFTEKLKRTKRPLDKKKFGMVCLVALLMVGGVIIALVVIVKDQGSGSSDSSANETIASTGASANVSDIGTVAPSEAASQWGAMNLDEGFSSTSISNDDDFEATTGANTLLVPLDEAIYMLYTSDDPDLNILQDISSDVFDHSSNPRYQARAWLLNNDTLLQSTIDAYNYTNEDLARIAQRYIMLVFYFSTVDESRNIDPINRNKYMLRRDLQGTSKFVIDPNTHECYWVENACGQNGNSMGSATEVQDRSPISYLNVSQANLIGTLPFELGYLSRLRELTVNANQIGGALPEMITNQLEFLYALDLSQNNMEGTLPTSLWTMTNLRFAYLDGNRFSGSLPQTLPAAPSIELEDIRLRDNQLTGLIPPWWTELSHLAVLSVGNNFYTGTLPTDWSGVNSLEFLDISMNLLTGSLPHNLLYGIPTLEFLYLDFNQLSGTLPNNSGNSEDAAQIDFTVTLSRATVSLEAVWLQDNLFTGTIPNGFGWEWNNLRQLELHNNLLTGVWECTPEEGTAWPDLEELAVDCLPDSVSANTSDVIQVGVDMSLCNACCIECGGSMD